MDKKSINVKKIVEICDGKLIAGNENIEINSYSKDSRNINDNDMYLGIKGEKIDGNDFIEQAFLKGAIGCITDKELSKEHLDKYKNSNKVIIKVEDTIKAIQKLAKYKRSLYNIPVIAITGSVRKNKHKRYDSKCSITKI